MQRALPLGKLQTRRDMRRVRQLVHFEHWMRRELDRLGAGDEEYIAASELIAGLAARASLALTDDYHRG